MVEYWFCMSAQSAQKKWEACKQVREGQPYKATPVTAFKSERDTATVGVLQSYTLSIVGRHRGQITG